MNTDAENLTDEVVLHNDVNINDDCGSSSSNNNRGLTAVVAGSPAQQQAADEAVPSIVTKVAPVVQPHSATMKTAATSEQSIPTSHQQQLQLLPRHNLFQITPSSIHSENHLLVTTINEDTYNSENYPDVLATTSVNNASLLVTSSQSALPPVPSSTNTIVLDEQQTHRYRRLKRICRRGRQANKNSNNYYPSFMKLLQTNLDTISNDDIDIVFGGDENEENDHSSTTGMTLEQLPKRIKVDLDSNYIQLDPTTTTGNSSNNNNNNNNNNNKNNTATTSAVLVRIGNSLVRNTPSTMTTNDGATAVVAAAYHHHHRVGGPISVLTTTTNTITEPSTIVQQQNEHPQEQQQLMVPSDEGWYEGVATLYLSSSSSPDEQDESLFLTPKQQFIRQNIQLFSSLGSSSSTNGSSSSAVPVYERGRVGVRCIHCTKANQAIGWELIGRNGPYNNINNNNGQSTLSDVATIPTNTTAIYNYFPDNLLQLSSSPMMTKFQSHFLNSCPNIPDASKIELLHLLEDSNAISNSNKNTGGSESSSKLPVSSSSTLSHAMYNEITARRIGLVDVLDRGIRFSRDLQCQPLPFANVQYRVEHESMNNNNNNNNLGESTISTIESQNITADRESEAVLVEAVAEPDDENDGDANDDRDRRRRLCTVNDKVLLSDFIFLTMRQMSLCRVIEENDFSRTEPQQQKLQVGYAGFCCRWCMNHESTVASESVSSKVELNHTARFFPSKVDQLSSAIGVTFVGHLQKCHLLPTRLKDAITAYKKLHVRQMSQQQQQLPLGANQQQLMYQLLWSRLRDADRVEDSPEAMVVSDATINNSNSENIPINNEGMDE